MEGKIYLKLTIVCVILKKLGNFERIQRNFLTSSIFSRSHHFLSKGFCLLSLLSLLSSLLLLLLLSSICCFLRIKLTLYLLEIVVVAFSHTLTGSVNQPRFTKVKYIIYIIILSYNLVVTCFTFNVTKNGN